MEKIWYLKIFGNREGPYSVKDLKRDRRIRPTTLVWRQGFDTWQEIRYVPELQSVLEGEERQPIQPAEPKTSDLFPDDEIVVSMRGKDPNKWFWILILLLVACFLWVQLWT